MTINRFIIWALGNVPLLGLALAVALPPFFMRCVRQRLDLVLVIGLGVPMLWAAFFHLALPDMAARLIGWAPSPFQREVGFSDLAMGLVACLAAIRPMPFKSAVVWTLALTLYGDAAGHLWEIASTHNYAPGNAGSILWWDVLAPSYALALLIIAGGSSESRLHRPPNDLPHT